MGLLEWSGGHFFPFLDLYAPLKNKTLSNAVITRFLQVKRMKLDFVRRGGTIFHGGDVSVVVRKGCYVSSLEMSYIPIGREDGGW